MHILRRKKYIVGKYVMIRRELGEYIRSKRTSAFFVGYVAARNFRRVGKIVTIETPLTVVDATHIQDAF